ncbi:Clathrin light chain [Mucor velutinosus]|uniref:Clathrin light chain n=1 Tax=Mucor velutinosus TaxID=708070 RepID=A0AAN7DP13_9FUNG|nr:Clathrin light chain [Mucor velutinosus]
MELGSAEVFRDSDDTKELLKRGDKCPRMMNKMVGRLVDRRYTILVFAAELFPLPRHVIEDVAQSIIQAKKRSLDRRTVCSDSFYMH